MTVLRITVFILFVCFNYLAFAAGTLLVQKIEEPIEVDGVIDPAWQRADSVSDFHQYMPYYGEAPSRKTVAKVLTSERALYCLMIAYDHAENIEKHTGTLDDFGGDVVSFMIDTFGDSRTAYKFAVSASGVKSDCRLLDDARNRDYSWDGVWFADSRIYSWGFVVEMEIPYRSIQYEDGLDVWGLDFDRWIPSLNEDIYWCEYGEVVGQRISAFGKLAFVDFKPSVRGLNLEIYPVGLMRADYVEGSDYKTDPEAGIDLFYNPSQQLTLQLTANPDFAQIEADPYDFNISRYESYFDERRPFFTEGNEVFMASGKQRNMGFYQPLELFYSRRIGKQFADGTTVPIKLGTKAFGRYKRFEYGGFLAVTGEKKYVEDDSVHFEPRAQFVSGRLKKQIINNSSAGILFVGKRTEDNVYGVLDIDGAIRGANWQAAYQLARSIENQKGDYAASVGFTHVQQNWLNAVRVRYIGEDFDISQVGYVPWSGTTEFTFLLGPRWYFEQGSIRSILLYGGAMLNHEKVDAYTDKSLWLGYNMQFRNNWGFELNLGLGKSKDEGIEYDSYEWSLSSWYHISPKWNAFLRSGLARTYNFNRDYLSFYNSWQGEIEWQALDVLKLGTTAGIYIEGDPDNQIEEIIYNARPHFSLTPVNNLNIRVYVDNLYERSAGKTTQLISGFLFSYNFSPKSWIYLALNDFQQRDTDNGVAPRLDVQERAGVFKLKYLFYF